MLIVVEDGGGLANRLFVFANVLSTGINIGHRVMNPAFRQWSESFEGTAGDALSMFPRRPIPLFGQRIFAKLAASLSYRCAGLLEKEGEFAGVRVITLRWPEHYDLDTEASVTDLRRRRLVLLKGWLFRNRSGVCCHQATLRRFFRPVRSIRDRADGLVKIARRYGEFLVGVHVRHRDYRDFMGGRYFYNFQTYVDLMRSVATVLTARRPAFIICSDEDQDTSIVGDLPVTFSTMGPVEDIWALSRCDMVMGPPSTFSTWAAFLGQVPQWEIRSTDAEPDPEAFLVPDPVPRLPDEAP